MAARMAIIRTTVIWNVKLITSRPEPLYYKKGESADVLPTDEDDDCLIETEDERPMYVVVQLVMKLDLHVFQETTLGRRIETIVETKVASSLETASHEGVKREGKNLYQAVDKIVHRVVARSAINEVIHMKVDKLVELQEYVQHLTSNLINNPSFTVPIPYLLKQHAKLPSLMMPNFMTKAWLAPTKRNNPLNCPS